MKCNDNGNVNCLPDVKRFVGKLKSLFGLVSTKQAGHSSSNHFLSEYRHLPEKDHKYITKARQIANIFKDDPR